MGLDKTIPDNIADRKSWGFDFVSQIKLIYKLN